MNSRGGLFGGYYGVLSDSIFGILTMTALDEDEYYITTDLRIQFLRTINSGTLVIKGKIIHKSRSFVYCEASFYDEKDNLLAKAYATQSLIPIFSGKINRMIHQGMKEPEEGLAFENRECLNFYMQFKEGGEKQP